QEETVRRLGLVVEFLGNNRVAQLLQVSRSQPSRWRHHQEGVSPESGDLVIDLDYVLQRFRRVYDDKDVFWIWLNSQNPYLGARPIDAIMLRGPQAVVPAIDALAEGASV
ncbi:MAG TPA: hypothetical protein VKT80_03745, partial [Chloroflexota bacterium]|nr:hypothetical protein [Chloroflexota bacterium]